MKMEYSVGEGVLVANGVRLKVEKEGVRKCGGCFYLGTDGLCRIDEALDAGFCSAKYRSDKTDVVFKVVKDNNQRYGKYQKVVF